MVGPTSVAAYLLVQAVLGAFTSLLARGLRGRLLSTKDVKGWGGYADRRRALALGAACTLVYLATTPGTTTTLDEDLLALVRALSRGHTFEITRYTRSVHDASFRDGQFFSHKPPGTALVALPFYNFPRLLRGLFTAMSGPTGARIVQGGDERLVVDRCPGPSTYVIECQEAPPLAAFTLVVYETFSRPPALLIGEVRLLDASMELVHVKVDDSSNLRGFRPALETVDGDPGEDAVHGWPGAVGMSALPVYITWRLDRPVAISRILLVQLSPYSDHLIRSFELIGKDTGGVTGTVATASARIEPSVVEWSELAACGSVGVVSGIGVGLLFLLLRSFGVRCGAAVCLALLFAFGTVQWRYAAVLYTHSLLTASTLGVLLGLRLVLCDPKSGAGWWILGIFSACALLADTIGLVVVAVAICGPAAVASQAGRRNLLRLILPLVSGLGILGLYQWSCFGSPFAFPQSYSYRHVWLRSPFTAFNFSVLRGLWILLFHRGPLTDFVPEGPWIYADLSRTFSGLFVSCPYLLFSIVGLRSLWKREPRFALAGLVLLAATILIMGSFLTPWGGDDYDVRYIHHVVPVLFLPLGIWVDEWLGYPRPFKVGLAAFLAAAVWVGLVNNVAHLAEGPGREDLVMRVHWPGLSQFFPVIPCFPAWPLLLVFGPSIVLFVVLLFRRPVVRESLLTS